eukprot:733905-Rhodomonas_salina.1
MGGRTQPGAQNPANLNAYSSTTCVSYMQMPGSGTHCQVSLEHAVCLLAAAQYRGCRFCLGS